MTRAVMVHRDEIEQLSDREFFSRIFGHPPRTKEQRLAEDTAYWAEYRKQARAELNEMRERLCKQASPELQAQWRDKWSREDREADARVARTTHSDPLLKRGVA